MEQSRGLLILLHNGFTKISVSEILNALPTNWQTLDRVVKKVNYSELVDRSKLCNMGYEQYALEYTKYIANDVMSLITKSKN